MNKNNWKEHESFIAFVLLVIAVVGLVIMASTFDAALSNDVVAQAKIRILDSAVTGLIAILGMAAQAIFRTSQADKDLAAAAKATAEKVPPVTGEAKDAENSTTTV